MSNHVINISEGSFDLRELARSARIDMYDRDEGGIFTTLSDLKTPGGNTLVTIGRQMQRTTEKHTRADEVQSYRTFPIEYAKGIFDTGVKDRIGDVSFPFEDDIRYFGPLSDIKSDNMQVFMPEDVAELLDDGGVNLDLMDEELSGIESIPASEEQVEMGKTTENYRDQIQALQRQLIVQRFKVLDIYPKWKNLYGKDLVAKIAREGEGVECTEYIKLYRRLQDAKDKIDVFSARIVSETLPRIYVPEHVNPGELRFPRYDPQQNRFINEQLGLHDLAVRANKTTESTEVEIPEFEIDLSDVEFE